MSSNPDEPDVIKRPIVLAFHKLSPKFSFGVTNYSPKRFDKLLSYLTNNGYRFISKDELDKAGEKDVLITFDDGYAHLFEYLIPFIEKYQIKPLIFMPTKLIGQPNNWDYSHLFVNEPHLSKINIQTLTGLGVDFGSHGHSHNALTIMNLKEITEEIIKSKNILEEITGKEIDCFSYPFGRLNETVRNVSIASGYKHGFTMKFPSIDDSPFSLGRFPIYGYDALFCVKQKIEHGAFYQIQKFNASITNRLSGGTILLNRLRSR